MSLKSWWLGTSGTLPKWEDGTVCPRVLIHSHALAFIRKYSKRRKEIKFWLLLTSTVESRDFFKNREIHLSNRTCVSELIKKHKCWCNAVPCVWVTWCAIWERPSILTATCRGRFHCSCYYVTAHWIVSEECGLMHWGGGKPSTRSHWYNQVMFSLPLKW